MKNYELMMNAKVSGKKVNMVSIWTEWRTWLVDVCAEMGRVFLANKAFLREMMPLQLQGQQDEQNLVYMTGGERFEAVVVNIRPV